MSLVFEAEVVRGRSSRTWKRVGTVSEAISRVEIAYNT